MKLTHLFTFFFLFLFSNSFSKDTAKVKRNCFWVELGTGYLKNTNYSRYGSGIWFNVSHNNTLFTFRYNRSEEFLALFISPTEYAQNYAVMLGKLRGNNHVQVSASAGLGVSEGVNRGEYLYSSGSWLVGTSYYESKNYKIVNVPFEFNFIFKPIPKVPVLGLGIALTGDLNPKQSTIGLFIKAGIGIYPKKNVLKKSS